MTENHPDTNIGNIEYISRQAAIDTMYDTFSYAYCDNCRNYGDEDACEECHRKYQNWAISKDTIIRALQPITAADVVPVVHSRWIKTADGAECEKCGREAVYQIIDDHWQYEPWCPHCGAIMDGEG